MKRSVAALLFVTGCVHGARTTTTAMSLVVPTPAQIEAADHAGVPRDELARLLGTPLHKMKPRDVDRFLAYEQEAVPDLRMRVADLARKNLGQPYELYLLGEFPYEVVDDQPLFELGKSDCVVFVEHTYAMALSRSWSEFFWMLQRIRYKDGIIGVTTRNHYTEQDWDRENAWLVTDASAELAGDRAVTYEMKVDRQRFFRNRYKLEAAFPVQTTTEVFVPKEAVADVLPSLRDGDLVNVISKKGTDHWASHVGLVVTAPDGTRHFLHSSEPVVREETFASFIERAEAREAKNAAANKHDKVLAGFKFLRLNDAPEPPPMLPQPRPRR